MQQRAQVGGQVGANGEWYEGGKFIATVDNPKGKSKGAKPSRKQQYEPYKWDVAPEQGQRAIFDVMSGFAILNRSTMQCTRHAHANSGYWGYTSDELIAKWNSGIRWVMPTQDWMDKYQSA